MKPLPDDATIAAAIRRALPRARTSWLFGSAARHQARAQSDLDIAVVQQESLAAAARLDAAAQLAEALGRDVDLLDFARLSPVMQVQVLATGRRLFADDPVADLGDMARALHDYQDLQRWRRPMARALVDRLVRAGGLA